MSHLISVAMITMNEEKAVARVIEDICDALHGREYEIVIVDSSRDATPNIAAGRARASYGNSPPGLRPRHGPRAPGVPWRRRRNARLRRHLPGVGNSPPGRHGPFRSMRSGERLASGTPPGTMPLANYLANWLFAVAGWLLVGVKSTDLHSGMRAYSRRLIQEVEFDPNGPALPVELLLKPALQGFRIREVFIPYGERIGETTLQRWSSTVWTFRRIFRLAFSRFFPAPKRNLTKNTTLAD